MVRKKTVIVVGAGASKEFGLPIGTELLDIIKDLLYSREGFFGIDDKIIHYGLRNYAKNNDTDTILDELIETCKKIRKAIPHVISIDNLLDQQRGKTAFEISGKLAIARSILQAERKSKIFCEPHNCENLDFEQSKNTWLNSLFKIITENCVLNDLNERFSNVTFIVFNYDRCIEHYLFHALRHTYGITNKESKDLLASIKIFHPYGKVGELNWNQQFGSTTFGHEPNPQELLNISSQLKTFTEGIDSKESEIDEIRKEFLSADTVLFLGFAYHKLNMELLLTREKEHRRPGLVRYFGTSYGYSEANTESIRNDLQQMAGAKFNNIIIRSDLKCHELFNEYWRALSLSDL